MESLVSRDVCSKMDSLPQLLVAVVAAVLLTTVYPTQVADASGNFTSKIACYVNTYLLVATFWNLVVSGEIKKVDILQLLLRSVVMTL